MNPSSMFQGPRRLDSHQAGRVTAGTLQHYRAATGKFVAWIRSEGHCPQTPEHYDDLIVEWKNCCSVSKTEFTYCLAGFEFFFPRWKGRLSWAHAVASGRSVIHVPRHTVPLGRGPCALAAVYICSWGHARLAFGMALQQRKGSRPGELLGLEPEAVILPEEKGENLFSGTAEICLGLRTGTKAKRPQVVVVRGSEDADFLTMLRVVEEATPPRRKLIPYSAEQYRRWLKVVDRVLTDFVARASGQSRDLFGLSLIQI